MKYETWSINKQIIKDNSLNFILDEKKLKEKIALLMGIIQSSINCSGIVIAYKEKGHDWTYKIQEYSADLPHFMENMYLKGPKKTIYVIATIRELGNAARQQRPINEVGKAALGYNLRPFKMRLLNEKNGLET